MAIAANLVIDQGTDFEATIDVTDQDGDAVNITGFTVAGQIRKSYTSTTSIDFVTTVSDPNAGQVTIALTDTTTATMASGRYVYDLEMLDSAGKRTRIVEGQVEVTPGVTQI